MPDPLTVKFPYSPREHAEALAESVAGRRFRRFMRLFGLFCGILGLLVAGVGAVTNEPLLAVLQNTIGWMGLFAFWFWGAPAILNASERRQRRREAIEDSREVESLTFGDAGFSPSIKWPQPMPWSFVERVIETRRFLLIYHGYSKEPFYIPKHALSQSDKEQLSVLLNENLKSSQTQLQLLHSDSPVRLQRAP